MSRVFIGRGYGMDTHNSTEWKRLCAQVCVSLYPCCDVLYAPARGNYCAPFEGCVATTVGLASTDSLNGHAANGRG
jgi:hypothetical protein